MNQQEAIEFFKSDGYRIVGGNDPGDVLMTRKHGNGTRTNIIIYPNGDWDTVELTKRETNARKTQR